LTVAHYSWPNGSGIGYNCRSAHLAVSNIVDPCLPLLVLLFSLSTAAATPIQSNSSSQSRFCSRINKDFCFIVLIYCPLKRILPQNKCIIITCYNCNTDHQSWLHINKTRRQDGFSMQHTSSKKAMDVSSLTEHHKMQTQEWCQHRSTITKQQPRMHGMMHGMITYTIIEDLEFSGFPSSRSKALAGLSRDAIDQTHKITTASLFTPCLSSESSKHHKPSKRSQMGGGPSFLQSSKKEGTKHLQQQQILPALRASA
jgi:hypothetical protein